MGLNSHCLIGVIVILTVVDQNAHHLGLTCAQIEKPLRVTIRMIMIANKPKLVAKIKVDCEYAVTQFQCLCN